MTYYSPLPLESGVILNNLFVCKKCMENIQSVVFDKKYWTKGRASMWLKNNDFKNVSDVDEKPETYRYRQLEPKRGWKYITKSPSGYRSIRFIIVTNKKR